jgi:acyl transferase domain-containing protein
MTHLVKVSAASAEGLRAQAARLAEFADGAPGTALPGIAWTAGTGRADLAHRAAVVTDSVPELAGALRALVVGEHAGHERAPGRVVFVAPGHGVSAAGLLDGIYGRVGAVSEVLDRLGGPAEPAVAVLLDGGPAAAESFARPEVTQPALYALAVALGSWWRSVGIEPGLVLGHSVGGYAAAALAGVFSIEDGAALVAERGRLVGGLSPDGAMCAVLAPAEDLDDLPELTSGELEIAVYNGPRNIVLSGPAAAVESATARLAGRGIRTVRLPVPYAFHSARMDPVLEPLGAAFGRVAARPSPLLVSDTTGRLSDDSVTTAEYWMRHTRMPVRFADAVRTAVELGAGTFVELGPGTLRPLLSAGARTVASVRAKTDPHRALLEAAGLLWTLGHDLDWRTVNPRPAHPVRLPTYAFQHTSYGRSSSRAAAVARPEHARPERPPAARRRAAPVPADELAGILRTELAGVLGLAPEAIDPRTGLFDLGLTSAMVVEVRAALERRLAMRIPATAVFDHPTIERLAAYLAGGEPEVRDGRRGGGDPAEPIAIIGMACRFPGGADDLEGFWRLLEEGRDGTGEVPAGRWTAPPGTGPARGGFLHGPVDLFDAEAFGISPREARAMDPQQRLLLEVAHEALDDAGVTDPGGAELAVYTGINTSDYMQLLAADEKVEADPYIATGNTFSVAAGRLSYVLGATGPSMAVDTACSSSLVALHLAVRGLRSGESDLALAAGVNLMLAPGTTASLNRMNALSPDGRCKSFDAAADGYGRGEGCGVVVLKRLSEALAGGDRIWAVVRGTAVNQDGAGAGLTVPNGLAQRRVIRHALADAGVEPGAIGYVEAHGTGTPLGDPLELTALAAALRPEGGVDAPELLVGSVKTNVGHLEAAAGVCGLIKTALALHRGTIPAHLHLGTPNPHLDWAGLPVSVPTRTVPWPSGAGPRLAGVSAFGFSGTNAHAVLEEPPAASAGRVAVAPRQWTRKRHWLPSRPEHDPGHALARDSYEIAWRELPGRRAAAPAGAGRWVLLGEGGGMAGRVAGRLAVAGHDAVIVAGDDDPDVTRERLSAVLDDGPVNGVVHLGSLDVGSARLGPELDRALSRSCAPLLALPGLLAGRRSKLWAVTRGAVPAGRGGVETGQGAVWGLGRVVGLEHPGLWGGMIDLDPGGGDPEAAAAAITEEILAPDGEDQIAHRNGQRLAARLVRAEPPPAGEAVALDPSAAYLITGGRGALGLRIARRLVERGARHLILLGRRPADEAAARAVRELEASGATVHTPCADISDPDQTQMVLRDGGRPPIRGVVHAAGVFEPAPVADLTWKDFRRILRAKVEGTLVLDALGLDLDFFVMFSSASAVWGSALAGHYAAANHFQDVFAHDRVRRGLPAQAVNWGWWSGSDMVAGHGGYFEAMGLHVLPDTEGLTAFDRLAGAGRVQLTVAPVDWTRFRPVLEAKRARPLLAELASEGDGPGEEGDGSGGADNALLQRLAAASTPADRRGVAEDLVRRETLAVLGLPAGSPLDRELGFFEAGMDSIMSVELRTRLGVALGIRLPATVAFEHPTVASLAAFLLEEAVPVSGAVPGEPPADSGGPLDEPAADLAGLDEDELLRLLEDELEDRYDRG